MDRLKKKGSERIIKQINNNLLKIILEYVGTEVGLEVLEK
jgi:hypothetical protein